MTVNELYEIAEKNGIKIYELSFDNIISVSVPENIAIDKNKIHSNIEMVDVLSHELGHCITNSFYNSNNILDVYEKKEHIANLWKMNTLIPLSTYIKAIANGITDVRYFAYEYDLSYEFAAMVADYYNSNFDINKLVAEYKCD